MASIFPMYQTQYRDLSIVRDFVPYATAFVLGDLVFFDTGDQTIKVCGADPALILGLSEVKNSVAAAALTETGRCPLLCINPGTTFAMCSATAPLEAHIGVAYGIVKANNVWKVDISDTSATKVVVVAIDALRDGGTFYVQFLAGSLQFDAIAS